MAAAQRLGLPASLTTQTDLPYAVAAAGALRRPGPVPPQRYCLALAASISGQGSRLRTDPATGVEEGSSCVVRITAGSLEPDHAVVVTQLPFNDRGAFFAKCHLSRPYALAVRLDGPVPEGCT